MKLNKNGLLARFYKYFGHHGITGDDDLPDDFCSFFWGLVGRVVQIAIAVAVGFVLVLCVVGLIVSAIKFSIAHTRSFIVITTPILVVVALLWSKKRFEVVKEVIALTDAKIDSVKKDYCPRIEWHGGQE